jgi:hypothetical protein
MLAMWVFQETHQPWSLALTWYNFAINSSFLLMLKFNTPMFHNPVIIVAFLKLDYTSFTNGAME